MEDMTCAGEAQQWTYHDGTSRRVVVTDVETLFPSGELIVSQTDRDGIITTCNDAFVLMSGFEKHQLIGAPHSILRHPDMPRAAFADLWSTVNQGKRWSGYVKNLRADGGYYWVYATVIPKVRGGEIVGHTSVRREPSRDKVAEMAAIYRQMILDEGR
ncbi:MAG: PAS domain-containing protein [Propionibacteriaceae bacterium]|nr:PAS domain-containing protein [Propionibacteriaceae bacterium]